MKTVEFFTLVALLGCSSCAPNTPRASDEDNLNQQSEDQLRQYFEESREAYFASADSPDVSNEDRIRIKLDETLFNFSQEHSISSYDLRSMLGDLALDAEYWSKGGVGIVDGPLYVVVEGANNTIGLGEGREWVGKPSSEAEVVFVSSDREVVNEASFDYNDGIVIFFSPSEIRFVDFRTNSGGRYKRASESDSGK